MLVKWDPTSLMEPGTGKLVRRMRLTFIVTTILWEVSQSNKSAPWRMCQLISPSPCLYIIIYIMRLHLKNPNPFIWRVWSQAIRKQSRASSLNCRTMKLGPLNVAQFCSLRIFLHVFPETFSLPRERTPSLPWSPSPAPTQKVLLGTSRHQLGYKAEHQQELDR